MERGHGPRLVSVGSIVADIRLDVPHLPARGGNVIGSPASMAAGGGFNILSAAARQGMAAQFAGRHGTGPYGDCIRAGLAREGIAALHAPAPEGDSGFCLVMVEPDGERTFVSSPGVEAALGERKLAHVPLRPGDWVFVSGYDLAYPGLGPAIAAWVAGLPRGVRLVVDPGPLAGELSDGILSAILPQAAVWTINRHEAALLTGFTNPAMVRPGMPHSLPPGALLIIRDGAAGAYVSTCEKAAPLLVPAPAVHARDTTGAGDTHTGVLIAALAQGFDPPAAALRANAAAAISVTRNGPATAPTASELDRFLAASDGAAAGSALQAG